MPLDGEAARDTTADREAVMERVDEEEGYVVMVVDGVRDSDFVDVDEAVPVPDFVLVLLAEGDLLPVADRVFVRVDVVVFVDVDVATMAAPASSRAPAFLSPETSSAVDSLPPLSLLPAAARNAL